MSRSLLLLAGMLVCLHSISQEDEIITSGTTKISRQLTPKQIIASLARAFPGAVTIEYFITEGGTAKEGWTITEEEGNACQDGLAYYIISFKRGDLKYYGLFSQDGQLVMLKVKQDLSELPNAVKESLKSLGKEHYGYRLLSKTYYKNQNQLRRAEYYEVVAERGKEKKRLFYNLDGTLATVR